MGSRDGDAFVNRLRGQNTGSADFVIEFSVLVELEGDDVS